MASNRNRLTAPATLALTTLLGACAQEVGDIDRVDDNLLPKAMFDGQWYMLQTVVDTNATAAFTFAGLQGPLERVHFEFSDQYMIARRVHEDIIGMDLVATNVTSQPDFDGSIVAAYSVTHTDVQRGYNASTGEQSNIVSENASDRRWYERGYVRANFNDNFIETNVNSDFAAMIEDQGKNWITLPSEESQGTLVVDVDDEGNPNYFEFVTTYIGGTDWWNCFEMVGFPGWGVDCGTEEMVVRTSFLRIDTEDVVNEHVPREYGNFDMNLFGFFQKVNCFYDERYDCTDFSRVELATIHDIWSNDRTEDGRARPYAERTPKPIAYYLSDEYPTDLIDEAFEIAEQYSFAFRRTIAGAQGKAIDDVPRMFYACLNPGSDDPAVPEDLLRATLNPSDRARLEQAYAASAEGYRLGACKAAGTVKNTGDLRYSFFTWRTDPSAPWYGYGPSAADPLTGEVIQAAANFNGGHLSRDSERILNILKIIEGELTPEEYGYGVNIQEYFERLRQEADYDLYFGARQIVTEDDDKAIELAPLRQEVIADRIDLHEEAVADRALVRELLDRPSLQALLSQPVDRLRVRDGRQLDPLAAAIGSPLDTALQTPEWIDHMTGGAAASAQQLASLVGSASGRGVSDVPQSVLEDLNAYASPLQMGRVATVLRRNERMRERLMGDDCVIMAEDFDRSVIGFAEEMYRYKAYLETTYPTLSPAELDEQLWLEVRGRIYTGIQAHEIGHTVGLRHNFVGTADALNYFPQYWSLRQQTFDQDCDEEGYQTFRTDGFATGDVAPTLCGGSETPEEEAERSAQIMARLRTGVLPDGTELGSINHYEYSTVMDYHGDFNGRQGGLGLYDYAAVAYGYGELLEVFEQAPHRLDVRSSWDPESGDWSETTIGRDGSRVRDMDDVEVWFRSFRGGPDGDEEDGDPDDDEATDNQWHYWHYSVLPIMFFNPSAQVDTADLAQKRSDDHISFTGIGAMADMYNRRLVSASDCRGGACSYCATDADCAGAQVCYRNPLDPRQMNLSTPGYCTVPDAGAPLLAQSDVVVPYRFCEDYLRGTSSTCAIFDGGADELEIVTRIIEDYKNYYPLSSFRRGRPAFGLYLWPFISREIEYTFRPAVAQYQFWLLSASSRGPEWYAADRAGLTATLAMEDALNFVAGVLTIPSVGSYAPDLDNGGVFLNIDSDVGERRESYDPRFGGVPEGDYVDLSVADGGRYQYSQFVRRREDDQAGYHYFYQYEVLSHFYSKYAAIFSLVDGSVDIIGADTDSDNTAFYIPPYLAFPDDVGNWFGGIMAEQISNIGMCATRDEGADRYTFTPIEMLRSANYRCNGSLVNPYTSAYGNSDYNMRLYATILAAANFSANLDYSWFDQASVYVWGRGETPDIIDERGNDFEWLTYTDEMGTTYAARYLARAPNPDYIPGEDPPEDEFETLDPDDPNSDFGPNVGYRMVQRAIDLQVEHDALVELEREAQSDPRVVVPDRDSTEVYYELDSHLETIRFLVEANKFYQF